MKNLEKKAIWKWNNEEVVVVDILESHNECLFITKDGYHEHDDLKNIIFI